MLCVCVSVCVFDMFSDFCVYVCDMQVAVYMRSRANLASRPQRVKGRMMMGAGVHTASWAMGAGTDRVKVAAAAVGAQRPLALEVQTPTDACQCSWWPTGGDCSL